MSFSNWCCSIPLTMEGANDDHESQERTSNQQCHSGGAQPEEEGLECVDKRFGIDQGLSIGSKHRLIEIPGFIVDTSRPATRREQDRDVRKVGVDFPNEIGRVQQEEGSYTPGNVAPAHSRGSEK